MSRSAKVAGSPPADCSTPEVDFLGHSDALSEQRYEGVKVGGLSGLAYDPERDVYYALPDGHLKNVPARFYTLSAPLEQGRLVDPVISDATIFRDLQGKPFTGANFDGEAIVHTSERELWIVSETEPSIRRFSREGRFLEELPLPRRFMVAPRGYARDTKRSRAWR